MQHENKIMKDEIKEYNQKEKSYELKIKNLEKNEDDLKRENYDLKKNGDIYLKQNAAYTKEIERIKQNYRIQMEQEKENYENRILIYENTIQQQRNKLSFAETKTRELVREQAELAEKYKIELNNAIKHYENILGGRANDIP